MRSGGRCGSLEKGVMFSSCNHLSVVIMCFWTNKNNTCLAVQTSVELHCSSMVQHLIQRYYIMAV